ncbi:hypothetical protein AAG906_009380 [Vitis piasezkii]
MGVICRYPFQPPSVTFATPIYHPNIDTGGRICLDILNLPPKGAWQPSLNISTVLTSIGLLLSEPNPDDGLMCEASKEYKYDRQAFDQKARSMTEKYAKAEASGNSSTSSNQIIQTNTNPSMMDIKGMDMVPKHDVHEYTGSHSKLSGICRKLSWEFSDSMQDKEVNEVPNQCLENQMVVKRPKKEPKGGVHDCNPSHEKLCMSRQKLSLESMRETKKRDGGDDKENGVPNYSSSLLNSQSPSMASKSLPFPPTSNHYEQQPQQDQDNKPINDYLSIGSGKPHWICRKLSLESSKMSNVDDSNDKKISGSPQLSSSQIESNVSHKASPILQTVNHNGLRMNKGCIDGTGHEFTNTKLKKLCSSGKKLSLGLSGSSKTEESDNKENLVPTHESSLMPQAGECYDWKSERCIINASSKKCRIGQKAMEPLGQWQRSNEKQQSLSIPQIYKDGEKQQSNEDEGEAVDVSGAEESPMPETIIVLDSEDSDEERNVSQRSRLPLACKRLAGKWRAKA